jgi:hypothetical protein
LHLECNWWIVLLIFFNTWTDMAHTLYYGSNGIRPQISHNWIQILLGSNLIDFTVQVLRVALLRWSAEERASSNCWHSLGIAPGKCYPDNAGEVQSSIWGATGRDPWLLTCSWLVHLTIGFAD